MESMLRFGERDCPVNGADFQRLARDAYERHARPRCMCRSPGIEMYIARVGGQFIVKRMPGTGSRHAMSCGSYEAPAALSGLGDVLGGAIRSLPDEDGTIHLRFEFTMTQRRPAAPAGEATPGGQAGQVASDGGRLSLRGLLHYLWSEAGLHRWSPAMHGKRNWFVVRKYLMMGAQNKVARAGLLGELLYVPEVFSVDAKDAIISRRIAFFERTRTGTGRARRLMILVAEVKKLEDARFGRRLVAWHLHDCPFYLRRDIGDRLVRRFAPELDLWSAYPETHLIACATFGIADSGVPAIEECSLMLADSHWLPFETTSERSLIERLVVQHRRFEKCLRYNLPADRPLASAVLSDTAEPVALYVRSGDSPSDEEAPSSPDDESGLREWFWHSGQETMPALPPPRC
ncbi:DUF1173 family protein [Rugamonas apoptosis]|uniref:DUF1173 domain-containing protein n=1 Tax=Rugamonas apoptosis TaxID=2758570 RepID=A0A7W2F8Q6_9BURK|nr:DUF1173 family protein [Rugamonas apoptosis]MBA5687221.1 DUF1173 domain-containing protein [Rugamonas apoptosis]